MMSSNTAGEFPKGLAVKLGEMDKNLKKLEKSLDPILSTSLEESYQSMSPLERAKYDLVSAYAINSLFWVYLRTRGEDAQEHVIKGELDRLKITMLRVKDIEDRAKAMRVDRPAAHRMVSKSLWQAKERAPTKNQVPRSRSRRRRENRAGKVALIHVLLVGDSMFRPNRVRPHLHGIDLTIKRNAMGAEHIHMVPLDPLAFPDGSCSAAHVFHNVISDVKRVCTARAGEVVAIPLWIGGNGFYTRDGGMATEDLVRQELARHLELTRQLLTNRNACVLVLGLPPRPGCQYDPAALENANGMMRQGVMSLASNRVIFHDVAPLLRRNAELFANDGVHLRTQGTEDIIKQITNVMIHTLPLRIERR